MKNDDFSKLNKAGMFTDIHFGRKNASDVHNSDCIEFIEWFIDQCKIHNVDHLIFLGDWFEHRDSISGKTLDYSHKAMKRIKDELGDLPFFFIVGNHDLVYRNTRNAFNTKIFEPFLNMIIVEENLSITIGNKDVLFCPFLFEKEYPKQISEINSHDVVFGHFEFKGFVVTGDTKKMDHGPEHSDFKKCKRIFTGHFHKRQNKDNVYYIGNTFPMDYSDANDTNRGMSIYEYDSDTLTFIDWDGGPSYMKCDLSDMIKSPKKYLKEKGTITCTADQKITYEEMITLQKSLTKKYNLRELNIQEPPEDYTISDEIDEEDLESEDRSEVVRNLLRKVVSKDIDNELLIKHFENAGKGIK